MAIEHIVGLVMLLLLIGWGVSTLGGDGGGNGSNSSTTGTASQNASGGTTSSNRSGTSGGGSGTPSTSLDQSSNAAATGGTQSTGPGNSGSETDDDRTRIRTADGDSGSRIELSVAGQSVSVRPGVTVGRELRRAMVDGGSTETAARHVSREHIEFRYEDDQLYVTDAGSAGGTKLGKQSISPGTWVEVDAGDSLTLADAVDVTITET